jgi:Tfp pilus assembly protein PilV
MKTSGRRHSGTTLVELVVAATVFTVVIMGVGSAYVVIQNSRHSAKQRLAAMLACQSMMDEIETYAAQNPTLWDPEDTLAGGGNDTIVDPLMSPQDLYNNTGFSVFNASYASGADRGEMGRGVTTGDVEAVGATLTPAFQDATILFPQSRVAAGVATPAILNQAGYVEVSQEMDLATGLVGRDLLRVDVVCAWRSFGGDTKLVYSVLIGQSQ